LGGDVLGYTLLCALKLTIFSRSSVMYYCSHFFVLNHFIQLMLVFEDVLYFDLIRGRPAFDARSAGPDFQPKHGSQVLDLRAGSVGDRTKQLTGIDPLTEEFGPTN